MITHAYLEVRNELKSMFSVFMNFLFNFSGPALTETEDIERIDMGVSMFI